MSTIIKVGNEMGVKPIGQKMAVACVKVECNFVMYANAKDPDTLAFPYDKIGSDGLSSGPYQQQPPWWGGTGYEGASKRMDVVESTRMFFDELLKRPYDDDSRTPGMWVYDVQNCAEEFKHRYDEAWGEAVALYNRVVSGGTPSAPSAFFTEHNIIDGSGSQSRGGLKPRLFVLHTEEGNMTGLDLDRWMDGMGDRSYHYLVGNDGVAWDLVDTDRAAWSVGGGNNVTINLVFTPSYASWTRQQWIDNMGTGIKIAAFLAAQDCHKYGIDPIVRVGKSASGYQSLRSSSGVTDHYGINVGLGFTNHTDVGAGFPWDLFNTYLQMFYAGATEEDDMFTDADRELLKRVHFELTAKWESRSMYATPGEGPVDTLVGMLLNVDGMRHRATVKEDAEDGDADAIDRIRRAAHGDGKYGDNPTVMARARRDLDAIPDEVLEAYEGEVA
ncbi:peptidoglycan recognition protein family protein [Mycolicibacterium palauense]|uniref:peptidoglycan recognition protein family protein n=1 Tax=Mycolicibacterium palauense TaxID=2034511 RepID=UPI00159B925C|nr:N-acetylmuramoyl-L-alanine amidase [Mycolicibacterium palauense]